MKRINNIACVVFLLSITLTACTSESPTNPNIIFILVDDMGYSDLGCMGSEISTPNLDKLAGEGILYTEMHNTAKCYPTRASMLTGVYFQQTDRDFNNTVMIAEILKENGYNSFWSGKHHGKFDPHTRGFDRFYGFLGGAINYINPGDAPAPGGKTPARIGTGAYEWILDKEGSRKPFIPENADYYSTDDFTDHAIGWLDEYKDDDSPFFLYLAYNAPHWPLHAKKEDIVKYKDYYKKGYEAIRNKRYQKQIELGLLNKETSPLPEPVYEKKWEELTGIEKEKEIKRMQIYAAMIDRLDQNIGRLVEKLKQENKLENTVIFFLSDNGACAENPQKRVIFPDDKEGEMGEVDSYEAIRKSWATVANTPLRYYKTDSYAGGIRTPMIVYCGENIPSKRQINTERLHLIDMMPTILSISNSNSEKYDEYISQLPGIDFSSSFIGGKIERNTPLYFQFGNGQAIIVDNWKLVKKGNQDWELFDLNVDKTEINNLAEENPAILSELRTKWEKWFSSYENL